MTVVQSLASTFVFPDPNSDMIRYDSGSSSLSSSYSDSGSYLGSIKSQGVGLQGLQGGQNQPSVLPLEHYQNAVANPGPTPRLSYQSSSFLHKHASSIDFHAKPHQLTIDGLVQNDVAYSTLKSIAQNESIQLSQLILHYNILNRLNVALGRFQVMTSESPRYDSGKFASYYQQGIELSLLKDEFNIKPMHFSSLLKYNQRELLNSFLTLLKSAPSFISTSVLSMSTSDLQTFIGSGSYEIDDVNRSKPLDILYYSIFPADTPLPQRYEYFSSVCASLLEHKRATNVCFAIFDRILNDIGNPFISSLEIILYSILQDGSFLCKTASASSTRPPHPSSTSTSEYSSPELGNATLAVATSSSSSLTVTSRLKLRKPSSISLSTSSVDEPSDLLTQEFLTNSVELLVEFLENKSTQAIPSSFLTFVKSVLSKLPEQTRRSATLNIVVKYFFSIYLRRLILYPERLGMLNDYYICENQRKKILSVVFNKLYQLVMSYVYGAQQEGSVVNSAIHEKTKKGLESILKKFEDDEEGDGNVLNTTNVTTTTSTSTITSTIGTINTSTSSTSPDDPHSPLPSESLYCSPGQFFILSPSDIVSLYSALFPSFPLRRSMNHTPRPSFFASSFNGDSSYTPESELDNYENDDSSTSTPILGPSEDYAWSLEDIKIDLEPVIEELIKKFPYLQYKENSQYFYSLRPSKLQNLKMPSPTNEKWQIFQVNIHSSVHDVQPESILDQMYTQGNDSYDTDNQIYPLPVAPANRGLVSVIKKAVEKIINQASKSPYQFDSTLTQSPDSNYLLNLLSNELDKSISNNKFLDANEYSNALNALKKLLPNNTNPTYSQVSTSLNNYIISLISKEKQFNLNQIKNQIELCRSYYTPFELQLQSIKKILSTLLINLNHLRTKVWYSTEIRNSALWTRAKDVALALNGSDNIETPTPYSPITFPSLKRNNSSSSVSSLSAFSFKRFTSNRDNRRQSINGNIPTEGMFAPKELGGQYKLSDREATATKKWLQGQNIQNFCTGEERIHRFCCEVDDLVKRIMGDALSSQRNKGHSLLSSSLLFRNDLWKLIVEVEGSSRSSTPSINPSYGHRASIGATIDNELSDINHFRNIPRSSSTYRGHRSQKSTPNFFEVFSSLDLGKRPEIDSSEPSSSSNKSDGIAHRRNRSLNEVSHNSGNIESLDSFSIKDDLTLLEADAKRRELDETILTLQMKLTSLIYTDIGTNCFYDGSETDKWIDSSIVTAAIERDIEQQANLKAAIAKNTQSTILKLHDPPEPSRRISKLGLSLQSADTDGAISNNPQQEQQMADANGNSSTISLSTTTSTQVKFSIDDAYKKILQKLSVTPSPLGKLHMLYELEMLVVSSLSSTSGGGISTPGSVRSHRTRSNITSLGSETPGLSRNVTRAPSISAMTSLGETIATVEAKRTSSGPFFSSRQSAGPSTDSIAEELRRILKSRSINSNTLFRDLQFISAFVPSHMLDLTDLGKAFWDVSLAALSIKEEALGLIVDTASEIFQYKTGMISTAGISDHKFLSQWSLADCAWLWSIASKEGDIAGQRELAIMHMSHPDLTPITLLPFSKISDVFEPSLLEDTRHDDLDKYDPIRMAIIKHWMSSAASYGDAIANEYLMQQTPQGYI